MISTNRAVERQPLAWSRIRSQDYAVGRLQLALKTGTLAPAYLFVGPSGCGKTSSAILFAMAQLCENPQGLDPCTHCETCRAIGNRTCPDFKFIDGTSDRSLAFIKEQLIPFMESQPWQARRRVLVIDEAHQYRSDAIQAFLTVLETLPKRGPHTTVVFCTTEMLKIPVTIRNRCLMLNFNKLSDEVILEAILAEHPTIDEAALEALLEESNGSMRSLYAIFDALDGQAVTEAAIRINAGTLAESERQALWRALEQNHYPKALALWNQFTGRKLELERVSEQILHDVALRMAENPKWPGWHAALSAIGFASVYNGRAHWAASLFTLLGCPATAQPEDLTRLLFGNLTA